MALQFEFDHHSHRRYNPLSGDWVLCSPHRAKRPWLGQQETVNDVVIPEYIPDCYLCPGNKRAGGQIVNPNYGSTFVFDNDFPAVLASQPSHQEQENDLFQYQSIRGKCQVICFSPKHNLTMAEMKIENIVQIITAWKQVYLQLSKESYVQYVQLFENKGSIMGCSNPHPHGQVWATEMIPEEPQKELIQQLNYFKKHGKCLLCDYVSQEILKKQRIVYENDYFVVLVPFWALWPFETMVLPKLHKSVLSELTLEETLALADALRNITCRYDNIFNCSFPYSMGIHQSPTKNAPTPPPEAFLTVSSTNEEMNGDSPQEKTQRMDCHLHIHFYPPLLRSATVKKFLVGFEMMGETQRDLTAEQAADRLRNQSDAHYINH